MYIEKSIKLIVKNCWFPVFGHIVFKFTYSSDISLFIHFICTQFSSITDCHQTFLMINCNRFMNGRKVALLNSITEC